MIIHEKANKFLNALEKVALFAEPNFVIKERSFSTFKGVTEYKIIGHDKQTKEHIKVLCSTHITIQKGASKRCFLTELIDYLED